MSLADFAGPSETLMKRWGGEATPARRLASWNYPLKPLSHVARPEEFRGQHAGRECARVHEGAEPSASGLPRERGQCRPGPAGAVAHIRLGTRPADGVRSLGRIDRCRLELWGELRVAA